MEYGRMKINSIIGLALLGVVISGPVSAQQIREAWSFSPQNRASIAALIKQVDDGDKSSSSTTTASGGTTLVCGADADSTAKGNSSCIILNNSTGSIDIGQDSDGDQTASNESHDSVNFSDSGADDVLEALNGH